MYVPISNCWQQNVNVPCCLTLTQATLSLSQATLSLSLSFTGRDGNGPTVSAPYMRILTTALLWESSHHSPLVGVLSPQPSCGSPLVSCWVEEELKTLASVCGLTIDQHGYSAIPLLICTWEFPISLSSSWYSAVNWWKREFSYANFEIEKPCWHFNWMLWFIYTGCGSWRHKWIVEQ